MIIGYTSGVFDLFHAGHLNLLNNAKKRCDVLVVGVCSDSLSEQLKGKKPLFCEKDRLKIVKSLRCVDKVVLKSKDDDFFYASKVGASIVFKGDDWRGSQKWKMLEEKFGVAKIKVCFIPYTKKVSSSLVRSWLIGLE